MAGPVRPGRLEDRDRAGRGLKAAILITFRAAGDRVPCSDKRETPAAMRFPRRAALAAAIVTIVAAPILSAAPAGASIPARASSATGFVCATAEEYWENGLSLEDQFSVANNALVAVPSNPTRFCAIESGNPAQWQQAGTGSCWTYSGPRSGPGVITRLGCDPHNGKASQQWWWTGTVIHNAYTGINGLCVSGHVNGGFWVMATCNGSADQRISIHS